MTQEVRYLDPGLVETICHAGAVELFDQKNDPVSAFSNHSRELLESALSLPQAAFGGRDMYPTLVEKAAVLWYTLNKNHPFQNGNKRISVMALVVFLYLNDHWLRAGIGEIVEQTLSIAKSAAQDRDQVLRMVGDWLGSRIHALGEDHSNLAA